MDTSKFQDKKEIKKFALYLGLFLLLIGLVQMFFGTTIFGYFFAAGLLILVIGLASPIIIKPVFILFSYLGFYLGKANAAILLTIFFYLFMTPISFLLKFAGKDVLRLKIKKEAESYWIKRETAGFRKKDFENQF
ncbi:MAG: hypothetical protein EXS48_00275 [Candidatus Staskawiczbacteria bacterium]|nr:hypothetical protein [Candidatus Staskawiczbacteria bacterium]